MVYAVTVNGRTLRLVEGDITNLDTDAIVNAANRYLQLGSGVAGAIRRKGGPAIQRACDQIGGCDVGDAVITEGGGLQARYVIHAVGPRVSNPDAPALLRSAVRRTLEIATENKLSSVALPAISTGVFGFPADQCAQITIEASLQFLTEVPDTPLSEVVICLYGQDMYLLFEQELTRQQEN